MGRIVGDWLAVLAVVAIVFILVRPRSKAAEAVEGFGSMMVAIVRRATGLADTGGESRVGQSGSIPRTGREA